MKTAVLNMKLEPRDLEGLRKLQRATGATVSEHARRAIRLYIAAGGATREIAGLLHGEAALLHKRQTSKKGRA